MSDSFMDKINELQNQYYSTHKKNTFFKNSQKKECAANVVANLSLEDLLHRTAYIIPNTNIVYIDYPVLKTYAMETTYQVTMQYICSLFKCLIEKYGDYECHLNLLSYTVSACERHKGIFNYLFEECNKNNHIYTTMISKFIIYNTPNTMANVIQIMTPLINPLVKEKVVMFDKIESLAKITALHQTV